MTEKPSVSIYLANISVSTFESTTDWMVDDLQLVYNGTFNCHDGWNTFQFDTVFFYTGGNILVVIDDNSGSYDGENYTFYFTNTTGNTVLRTESDDTHWTLSGENHVGSRTGHLSGIRPDAQFCIDVTCNTIDLPHIELSDIDPDCPLPEGENYTISPTVTGGSPSYTYYWSGDYNGHTPDASIPSNGVCTAYWLRLVVIDSMGCTDTAWREFTSIDIEPPYFGHPEVTETPATALGADCLYAMPDLVPLLAPGDNCTIDTIYQTPPSGDTIWSDTNAVLTVRDRCGNEQSKTVHITLPYGISAQLSHVNALCNLVTHGTIDLHDIGGGIPPYSIVWQREDHDTMLTLDETGDTVQNCPTGNYWATITDANGCWLTLADTVRADYDIKAGIYPFDVQCHQTPTGYILTDNVHGGRPPYSYHWSNGCTDSNAYNLMPGIYTLTITDQTGCWLDSTVTIADRDSLTIDTVGDPVHILCHGYHTGAFSVTSEGGVPPYSFALLSDTNNTGHFANLYADTHHVQVIDSLGCKDTLDIEITEPDGIVIELDITDLHCWQADDGSIELTLAGGTVPYTFGWSTGDEEYLISWLAAGDYSLHVSDGNGCLYDTTVTVEQPDLFSLTVTENQAICNGETLTLQSSATGGTEPYTFLWNDSLEVESQTVSPSATTTYSVTGSDANGCADTAKITITVKEPTSSIDKQQACDRYTWPLNDVTYTASTDTDFVVFHGGNSVGCDSTVSLELSIYYSSIIADTLLPVCFNQLPLVVGYQEYTNPGVYHTTLTTDGGCDSSLTFTLVIRDTNISYAIDSIFENRLPWFFRDRVYPTPVEDDIFVLENRWGCDSTVHYTLHVEWGCSEFLQFPSVVTANGDGINDVFHIYGLLEEDCYPENRLTIFNQWGMKVYDKQNIYDESEFWDPAADNIPAGTYFFAFHGTGFKGKTERRGSVEVMR